MAIIMYTNGLSFPSYLQSLPECTLSGLFFAIYTVARPFFPRSDIPLLSLDLQKRSCSQEFWLEQVRSGRKNHRTPVGIALFSS